MSIPPNCAPPQEVRSSLRDISRMASEGAALSTGVAFCAAPLDYLKNMIMKGSTPRLRNCFRGVTLTACNDVPAAVIAMSTDHVAKRLLRGDEEELSGLQRVASASVGGAFSGFCVTPGQMIVLNYQDKAKANCKVLSMSQICRRVYRQGGIRRLFIGGQMLAMRELLYAPPYLVLADMISQYTVDFFSNEEARVAVSGMLTGAAAGALTSPFDFLRIQMQKQALQGKVQSYASLYKGLGSPRMLFTGIIPRTISVAFAILLMVEGRRHLLE